MIVWIVERAGGAVRWLGSWMGAVRSARGSRGVVVLGSATVVALVASALAFGSPARSGLIDLLSGKAWLTDRTDGSVMLANGSSAELELKIKVPGAAGSELEVIQVDGQSLLVDRTTGDIVTLDLDTLDVGNRRALPGNDVDMVVLDDVLVVVDRSGGRVEIQEPLSGEVLDDVRFDGPVSRAVVDISGEVWVIDRRSGDAVPLEFDGVDLRRGDPVPVSAGAHSEIGTAGGEPVIVDPEATRLVRIRAGKSMKPVALELRRGERPALPRTTEGDLIAIAANEAGDLLLVEGDRSTRVKVRASRGELGEPVPYHGRVYVPDPASGELLVLERDGKVVPGSWPKGAKGEPFSVRVEGGRLWVDFPTDDSAFVLDGPSARFRTIDKRRPDVPTKDAEIPEELLPEPPELPDPPPLPTPTPTPTEAAPAPSPAAPAPTGSGGPAVIDPSAPGSPAPVVATPGDRSAVLAWAPAASNGSPVSAYEISWTGGGSGASNGRLTAAGTQLGVEVDGLRNGASYVFTVRAVNGVGRGTPARSDEVVPDGNVPDAPTAVTAAAAPDATMAVEWAAADPNGASPVVAYTVTAIAGDGGVVTKEVPANPREVVLSVDDGLVLGARYEVMVRAVNRKDRVGPESRPVDGGTVWAPAAAPTITSTQGSDQTVQVRWDPPASNGGTLVGYRVTGADGDEQLVAAPTATFSGKPNGTPYGVTVAAVTEANGTQQDGAPAQGAATPGRAPSITGLSSSAADRTITVQFTVDAHQSGSVTCEVVQGGARVWGPQGCSGVIRASFGRPMFNTRYDFEVRATNGAGFGATSATGSQTTGLKPLMANGNHWGCPGDFCGPDVSRMATTDYYAPGRVTVAYGTQIRAACQTRSNTITDPATGSKTDLWIRAPQFGDGKVWMSAHYFGTTDFASVVSGLPQC